MLAATQVRAPRRAAAPVRASGIEALARHKKAQLKVSVLTALLMRRISPTTSQTLVSLADDDVGLRTSGTGREGALVCSLMLSPVVSALATHSRALWLQVLRSDAQTRELMLASVRRSSSEPHTKDPQARAAITTAAQGVSRSWDAEVDDEVQENRNAAHALLPKQVRSCVKHVGLTKATDGSDLSWLCLLAHRAVRYCPETIHGARARQCAATHRQ